MQTNTQSAWENIKPVFKQIIKNYNKTNCIKTTNYMLYEPNLPFPSQFSWICWVTPWAEDETWNIYLPHFVVIWFKYNEQTDASLRFYGNIKTLLNLFNFTLIENGVSRYNKLDNTELQQTIAYRVTKIYRVMN